MYDVNYYDNGNYVGHLHLQKSAYLSRINVIPSDIIISSNTSLENCPVSHYIRTIYAEYYGANINVHYPVLLSLQNPQGDILAALGLRPASNNELFLEQYLEGKIESYIPTKRHQIVEIGNLASNSQGASLLLFTALSAYLSERNYTHAVITGTNSLEKKLDRMGLALQRIASADPRLLSYKNEHWGSYYETNPQVLVGSIAKGYTRLKQILNAEYYSSEFITSRVAML